MPVIYLVPTPIGNLKDITLRAIETLKEVDVVLCEDTRKSGLLLRHLDIKKTLFSFHQHNEHKVLEKIIDQLQSGIKMALITDAGTPGISDPGFLLVRACVANDIQIVCLPGATAFVPALVQSGLPASSFVFEGFLPIKKGRATKLQQLSTESRTVVLYESPHRLAKTLTEMQNYFGRDRQVSVSRELSKMFEETQRGTLEELVLHFTNHPPKGEIVVVIKGIE